MDCFHGACPPTEPTRTSLSLPISALRFSYGTLFSYMSTTHESLSARASRIWAPEIADYGSCVGVADGASTTHRTPRSARYEGELHPFAEADVASRRSDSQIIILPLLVRRHRTTGLACSLHEAFMVTKRRRLSQRGHASNSLSGDRCCSCRRYSVFRAYSCVLAED